MKKYVFDITELDDGDFWAALLKAGGTVSVKRVEPTRWWEVTLLIDPTVNIDLPDFGYLPFTEWFEDVFGIAASEAEVPS